MIHDTTGLSVDIPLPGKNYNSATIWLQGSIVRTIVLISLTIGIPYVTSYTGLAGRCLRLEGSSIWTLVDDSEKDCQDNTWLNRLFISCMYRPSSSQES